MLVLVIVNLLFVDTLLASKEDKFVNGWIPIARSNVFDKRRINYFETRHASAWKPSQEIDSGDIDYVKEEAIQIITPQQFQDTQYYDKKVLSTLPAEVATNARIKQKDALSLLQLQDQSVPKRPTSQETVTQRASKQLRSLSLMNSISKPLDKSAINITTADSEVSNTVKNTTITDNHYEVTEPSNVHELSTNQKNVGYKYRPPLVPVVLSDETATRNEYTNKLLNLLSKYHIKPQDMLDNYDRSKLHYNHNNIMFNLHSSRVSPSPLAPFRYNSLNHRSVDPLLAVLLSNYGFYLQGFYGLTNNYKNLYGYLASNNIHNNKPFGSYKIYSDTDSSN